jgi:small subunit ribosomal protein S17
MSETVNDIVANNEADIAVISKAEETVEAAANTVTRNLRKTRIGKVVSNKMQKTIVIAMEEKVRHPLYKKIMKRTIKFKAHDENNEAGVGDTVLVMETRPLSKEKHWRLVNIVERAK